MLNEKFENAFVFFNMPYWRLIGLLFKLG